MSELVPFNPEATPQQLLAQLEAAGNLSPSGLTLPPNITAEQYEAIGALLHQWGEGWKWAVGDWLIQGHGIFGDAFYQFSEVLQISVRSRQQYMQVSERIPPSRRRLGGGLRWSHHRAVCMLEPKEADRWLEKAAKERWTKSELEDAVRDRAPEPPPLAFQPTGYVVERVLSVSERIYAAATVSDDPEWYLIERRLIQDLAEALGAQREEAE